MSDEDVDGGGDENIDGSDDKDVGGSDDKDVDGNGDETRSTHGPSTRPATDPDESQSPPADASGEDLSVGGADDVPLADLARRVADRESGRGEGRAVDAGGAGSTDSPFEEMSVSEIDEETLWSSLGGADDPTANVGIGEPAEPVTESGPEVREYVVSKEKYCQKCPHLSDPPELTCTHEGTEIVEVVDSERFRVRNCPIVEEQSVDGEG